MLCRAVLVLATLLAARAAAGEDDRLDWWREARFGMFIHWGLYAIPGGEWNGRAVPGVGEWIMHHGKIPVGEYEQLAQRFNPTRFDARAWARLAKQAGMRYVVVTAKHHDGFCLFDSRGTPYDVVATPLRRDVLGELADACRAEALRIGWYYSVMDWHHPDYVPRRPWDTRPGGDYARYVEYMRGQLRELLSGYGPVAVLWFDGGWEHTAAEHRADDLVALARGLQPGIVINDRLRVPQDFATPEQHVPPTGLPGRDWETCMTMNDTWGYKTADRNWKPARTLLRHLIDIASKGGNFLLNVGPTAEGEIPAASVERLRAMGRWLERNGEAIYGTTGSPFRRLPWGRCTQRPGMLYLHVFTWPRDGRLVVPGLRSRVARATLLADGAALPVERDGGEVVVRVPEKAPDADATVVALAIEGAADVAPYRVREERGAIVLAAVDARVAGKSARFEVRQGKGNIGAWLDARDRVSWELEVARPGTFRVEVRQACPAYTAGTPFRVAVADQLCAGAVQPTASWDAYVTLDLGEVKLDAGAHTLTVQATAKPKHAVMNLRAVRLVRRQ